MNLTFGYATVSIYQAPPPPTQKEKPKEPGIRINVFPGPENPDKRPPDRDHGLAENEVLFTLYPYNGKETNLVGCDESIGEASRETSKDSPNFRTVRNALIRAFHSLSAAINRHFPPGNYTDVLTQAAREGTQAPAGTEKQLQLVMGDAEAK